MVKNFAPIIICTKIENKYLQIFIYCSTGPTISQGFALSKQQFYSRQIMLRLQSNKFL